MQTFLSHSCGKLTLRSTLRQTAWLLAAVFSTAAGIVLVALVRPGLPVRVLVVAVPVLCGLAYTRQMVRDVRKLDELQLRIQLEAAATACLGVFVAANIYPVVQIAGFVGPMQPFYVVFLLIGLVLAGYINACRRYR
jgi:hypothetical protein